MFTFSRSRAPSPRRQPSPKHTKVDVEWVMVNEDTPSSEQGDGVQSGQNVEQSKDRRSSTNDQKSNVKTNEHASTSPSRQAVNQQLKSSPRPSSNQNDLNTVLSGLSSQRSEISTMQTSLLEAQAQIQEERDLFQAQYYALRNQQEERNAKRAEDEKQEWKDDLETLRLEMTVRAMSEEERVEKLMLQMETVMKKVDDMHSSKEKKAEESEKTLQMLGNSIEQLAMGMQHLAETVSKMHAVHAQIFEAAEKDRKDLQAQFLRLSQDVEALRADKSFAAQSQSPVNAPFQANTTNPQQSSTPLNAAGEPFLGPRPFPKAPTTSFSPSTSNSPRRRHHRTSQPDHTFNGNIRPRGKLDCEWFFHHHDPW